LAVLIVQSICTVAWRRTYCNSCYAQYVM